MRRGKTCFGDRLPVLALLLSLALAPLARAAPATGCSLAPTTTAHVGQAISFSLQGCGEVTQVRFDFGDETPAVVVRNQTEAMHAFSRPGHFAVVVHVEMTGQKAGQTLYLNLIQTVIYLRTTLPPTHSSTLAVDSARGRAWCVNTDHGSVSAIDLKSLRKLFEVPVGRAPRTLALDGRDRLWVVNQDDATVSLLDAATGASLDRIALPRASRPYGIAIDIPAATAYITLEGMGELVRMDIGSLKMTKRLALFPSARALALAGGGGSLWVTRYLSPSSKAGDDWAEVAEVDGRSLALKKRHRLAPDPGPDSEAGSRGTLNALSAVVLSPDGREAWIAAKKDNTARGLARDGRELTFETSVRAVVSRLEVSSGREQPARRLDLNNRSLPSAIVFSRLGDYAFIAAEGNSEISVVDAYTGDGVAALEPPGNGQRDQTSYLAPTGLAIAGDLLLVHHFLSRELAVYAIGELGAAGELASRALVRTVEREVLPPEVWRGKRTFYQAEDLRMGKDSYLSCVVCHLDGGASDGRVWDFTDRGEGLRRTTTLLGRAGTGMGPLHWSANFDEVQDFEHDIRGPQAGEGFLSHTLFSQAGRDRPLGGKKAGLSEDLDALAAYVASLDRARPSPHRNPDGTFTAAARNGREIFSRADVGCAVCHVPPLYTDSRLPSSKQLGLPPSQRLAPYAGLPGAARSHVTPEGFVVYDVGTLKPLSGKRLAGELQGLDTPTLLGVWEGGPFLHDGSAATLSAVIGAANAGDRHGRTSHLSAQEKEELLAFLMQLESEAPANGLRRSEPRTAPRARPDGATPTDALGREIPPPAKARSVIPLYLRKPSGP